MEYLKFILYGFIQGFTEFIPVSSTAHLKVISLLLGIQDPGYSLSAIIQLGSVFAIIWYFRNEILGFKYQAKKKNLIHFFSEKKLLISIFIGTIPIIFLGGIIKLFMSNSFNTIFRSNYSIAIISLLMALYMYFADISRNRFIHIRNHSYLDSFLIGISQSLAILPGISRSGVTISTALINGWHRKDAAKFSFLLGVPAISLAALVEFFFSVDQFYKFSFYPLIFGLFTTFFASLLAIDFLIKHLSKRGMKLFIFYRLIFGMFILVNS